MNSAFSRDWSYGEPVRPGLYWFQFAVAGNPVVAVLVDAVAHPLREAVPDEQKEKLPHLLRARLIGYDKADETVWFLGGIGVPQMRVAAHSLIEPKHKENR